MYVPEIRFCGSGDLTAILNLNASSSWPWPDSVIVNDLKETSLAGISYLGAFGGPDPALLGYAVLGQESGAGLLMGLLVHQKYRRRGIGSQLLAAIGGCAAHLGLPRIALRVRESNAAAIALYEGFSFARGTTVRGYYSNGEDALLMSAPLPWRFLESGG